MVAAYGTLAAGGTPHAPVVVDAVLSKGAPEPVYWRHITSKKAMAVETPRKRLDPAVVYVLTRMMESVVQEGTARRALVLGRPVAGKTGTSNDQRDAWFNGFVPGLVAGVWVGYDDNTELGKWGTGGGAALPLWLKFMEAALKDRPIEPFAQPAGVEVVRIDPDTGNVASPQSAFIDEVFLEGTAPTEAEAYPEDEDMEDLLFEP